MATGISFALLPSRGRVPVRTALAGVVVGVAGVVAVLTFSATVQSVEQTPSRFGWGWDIATKGIPDNAALAELSSRSDVRGVGLLTGDLVTLPDGITWTMQLDPISGSGVDLTVLDGRLPVTAGEIAAGPLWLENRGLEVGDVVPAGNGSTAVSVVGEVLVPAIDEDAVGGTVVVADRHDVSAAPVTSVLIEMKPGVDRGSRPRRTATGPSSRVRSLPDRWHSLRPRFATSGGHSVCSASWRSSSA